MGRYAAKVRLHALSAIQSVVPRSVETLVDAPLPKNFIDQDSMMGETVNRDKPVFAQARYPAPM